MTRRVVAGVAVILVLAACTAPGQPSESQKGSSGGGADAELVLAAASEEDSLHPLMGYAEAGASKIFDGLVAYDANLDVQPALAREVPQPSSDATSWTVELRSGVRFHDGTTLDAQDVVATYQRLLDPAAASPLATSFEMLEDVEAIDESTVRFDLAYPYAPFAHKLTLGIPPSAALDDDVPVTEASLGTQPVGTGPFELSQWRRGQEMVLTANDDYWAGPPDVERLTVVFTTDDNTRAQRLSAGEIDGAVLPPALAETFAGDDGLEVVHHPSADYRTIAMPSDNAVTGDGAVRRALNLGVDRAGMVEALLAGRGEPSYTPIPGVLDEFADPQATFPFDRAQARAVLEDAGWTPGADGVRQRDGQRAAFDLMYPAGDTIRRDLAVAFAEDAAAIGVEVRLEGLGWEAIEPRMGQDAVVLGGGSPFDPDLAAYQLLHSSFAADGFNNPGSYANAEVDAALDRGRRELDPDVRANAYRQAQRAYVEDPGFVFLVFLDHSYVLRQGWAGYEPIVEPHVHGITWGPWWNIEDWTRR